MVTLDTDRLHLREPTIDDLADLHELTAPDEMRVYLGHEPPSLPGSFDRLLRNIGGWTAFGYGTFMVEERGSGEFVGSCGVFRLLRGMGDDFDPYPEVGWIIAASRWGRGYAGEAMDAALGWFEATHGRQRTTCMISPGNLASERLAARLGYRPIRIGEHKSDTVRLYVRGD